MVTSLMAGARASSSSALASGERWGHLSREVPPEANFMAKAKQVGKPHSLQFFFPNSGSFLTTSVPLSGIHSLLFSPSGERHFASQPGMPHPVQELPQFSYILHILFGGYLVIDIRRDGVFVPLLDLLRHPHHAPQAAVGLKELGRPDQLQRHAAGAVDLFAAGSSAGDSGETLSDDSEPLEIAVHDAKSIHLGYVEEDGLKAAAGRVWVLEGAVQVHAVVLPQ